MKQFFLITYQKTKTKNKSKTKNKLKHKTLIKTLNYVFGQQYLLFHFTYDGGCIFNNFSIN